MPTVSRNAVEFMRRMGLIPTPRVPMPQLDLTQLRTSNIPLKRSQLDPHQLYDAAGSPAPDHGPTDQWPPEQEVS